MGRFEEEKVEEGSSVDLQAFPFLGLSSKPVHLLDQNSCIMK
jgi:hypothetical protein